MEEYKEQALAMLLVKDGLGEFYEEQKQMYLDTILALPVKEAATVLNSFVEIGFLTREELSANVKKLFAKPAPAQPAAPAPVQTTTPQIITSHITTPQITNPQATTEISHPPTSQNTTQQTPQTTDIPTHQVPPVSNIWGANQPTLETKISSIRPQLASLAAISDDEVNALVDSLSQLNVFSIDEVIQTHKNNNKFNFLNDLMPRPVYETFLKSVNTLSALPCTAASQRDESETIRNAAQLNTQVVANNNMMHHMWNNSAQLLVFPLNNKVYFFCSVETPQNEATLEKGEHLFFLLDVSASMNHNEKGEYCAPKSPDHPASSIKKARNLIPQLAVPALKRNVGVSIIIWNYKIQNTIEFNPATFQDAETGVFQADEIITAHVVQHTNENVFKARGGTNIEVALKELGVKMKALTQKVAQINVWFLTDGEETVYLQPDGECAHIPTNPTQGNFLYFSEENEEGTTAYQRKLVKDMVTVRDELRLHQCYMQFHACHLGEAHPLFLKTLATGVDGHFHTFNDVANIARELNANLVASTAQVTILGRQGERPEVFPAALRDGFLCSRGELSHSAFESIRAVHKPIIRTMATGDVALEIHSEAELTDSIKNSVASIISLERDLENILRSTSENVRMDRLNESSNMLRNLRQRRIEFVTDIPREIRANPVLLTLLETVLESVETQMESFTRLLDQYIKVEGTKFDKDKVGKNDMFTAREQMAISANVESMRVQMGKGFVAKNLDKQIQKLVAANGPRAMRMLERMCLVAETIKGDFTHLSLFVVEGRELKSARAQCVQRAQSTTSFQGPQYTCKYTEVLSHNDENAVIAKVKVLIMEGGTKVEEVNETIPLSTLYPHVVESYYCVPKTDDLDDACKRFLDPLSFSNFLELIRENNTLPAYLYTINTNQSVGLLFNAREMIYVKSGGSDATSADYFRFFWRMAEKDANKCVKVPGTFTHANFCLPIAPEPMTNKVLSCLMPGLISEFVTGTPMAPLPGIVDFYCGFLFLHMRNKHTGLDITRIAEIASTMRCWIDNPHTTPKPEDFRQLIDNLVKDQGIVPGESPGKLMPVKAFVYSLLDDLQPAHLKFSALYNETYKRTLKQLLVPTSELNKNPKVPAEVAANQTGLTGFFHDLVAATADGNLVEDEVPVSFLTSAHRLSAIVTQNDPAGAVEFLDDPRRTHAVLAAVWQVLGVKSRAAYPADMRWTGTQRAFAVWLAIATYPISALTENFAQFRAPDAFEAHMGKMLRRLVGPNESFNDVIFQWVEEKAQDDPSVPGIMAFEFRNGVLFVRDTTFASTPVFDCEPTIRRQYLAKLWTFLYPVLNMWYWKQKPGSAYNLLDMDFDLVRALRDTAAAERLTQPQCAELNAIREYKNPLYFKYLPPRPTVVELSQEARFAATQAARTISGKARISIIFIGAGNCGKSTIAGHILLKRGIIDPRTIQQYRHAAASMGKENVEFAWILNRFKQERERGVSIEAHNWGLETERYEVDIVDAPGHSDFIKNMMVGASLADVAFLVISAAQGEFESGITRGGMTREEALVAYAVGIRRFVVLVTKMEKANYSQTRFEEIASAAISFLRHTGVSTPVPVLPVSGLVGDNLVEISTNIPWFVGTPRTVLEALDSLEPPNRMYDGPARVPILKTYKISGVGTVASGRVVSGTLKVGDPVVLLPSGITTEVGTIEMYHTPRQVALPGDLIAFKLKNVSRADIPRGLVACPATDKPPRITSFIALIAIIDHPTSIHAGFTPFICVHTKTISCRMVNIIERVDKANGKVIETAPKSLKKGDAAHVEFVPEGPIYVEPITKCPSLARFVARDGHGTVAVGVVKSVVEARGVAAPKGPTTKSKLLSARKR